MGYGAIPAIPPKMLPYLENGVNIHDGDYAHIRGKIDVVYQSIQKDYSSLALEFTGFENHIYYPTDFFVLKYNTRFLLITNNSSYFWKRPKGTARVTGGSNYWREIKNYTYDRQSQPAVQLLSNPDKWLCQFNNTILKEEHETYDTNSWSGGRKLTTEFLYNDYNKIINKKLLLDGERKIVETFYKYAHDEYSNIVTNGPDDLFAYSNQIDLIARVDNKFTDLTGDAITYLTSSNITTYIVDEYETPHYRPFRKYRLDSNDFITDASFSNWNAANGNYAGDLWLMTFKEIEYLNETITQYSDANGNIMELYYGSNANPISNSAAQFNHSLLTGIEQNGMQKKIIYDPNTLLVESTNDENNNTLSYTYDDIGRLTGIINNNDTITQSFAYGMPVKYGAPWIKEQKYLTFDDKIVQFSGFDGYGRLVQNVVTSDSMDYYNITTKDTWGRDRQNFNTFSKSTNSRYLTDIHVMHNSPYDTTYFNLSNPGNISIEGYIDITYHPSADIKIIDPSGYCLFQKNNEGYFNENLRLTEIGDYLVTASVVTHPDSMGEKGVVKAIISGEAEIPYFSIYSYHEYDPQYGFFVWRPNYFYNYRSAIHDHIMSVINPDNTRITNDYQLVCSSDILTDQLSNTYPVSKTEPMHVDGKYPGHQEDSFILNPHFNQIVTWVCTTSNIEDGDGNFKIKNLTTGEILVAFILTGQPFEDSLAIDSTYDYEFKIIADVDNINQSIDLDLNYKILETEYYSGGLEVWKETVTTDENGNDVYMYTNELGQNVLERKQLNSTQFVDTQFKYDIAGNLVEVRSPNYFDPPAGSDLSDWITNYRYNTLGQLIAKATPDLDGDGDGDPTDEVFADINDCDIRYKYDANGNLRFVQDANHRNKTPNEEIVFYSYDAFNRVTKEGEAAITDWTTLDSDITYDFENFDLNPDNFRSLNFYDGDSAYAGARNLLNRQSCVKFKTESSWGYTYYSYTDEGWLEWIVQDIMGLLKKIEYDYDLQGNLTKMFYNQNEEDALYLWYDYNNLGQLYRVYSNMIDDKLNAQLHAEYEYWPTGAVKTSKLGQNNVGDFADTLNYTYTERDWLKSINAPNGVESIDPNDPGTNFAMSLYYNDGPGSPQYNGNIPAGDYFSNRFEGHINSEKGSSFHRYLYNYDAINRLTAADFNYSDINAGPFNWTTSEAFKVDNINYDAVGNILTLNRKDDTGLLTEMDYEYYSGTNRLEYVNNYGNQVNGNYSYDSNGNLIQDVVKSIDNIQYNYRNLPSSVQYSNGNNLVYDYDQQGNRIRKYSKDGVDENTQYYLNDANGQTLAIYDENGELLFWNMVTPAGVLGKIMLTIPVNLELNNKIYNTDQTIEAGNSITANSVEITNQATVTFTAGSQVSLKPGFHAEAGSNFIASIDTTLLGSLNEGISSNYYLKDHLGNIRVTIDGQGELVSNDDYYPFGLQMPGRSSNVTDINDIYKFSGKELDEENGLDWYYFGARYYDPAIARWLQVDPLASKYPSLSPYNYVANNPISAIDPDGRDIMFIYNKEGASGRGHTAVIIGNDQDGWSLYSKNGENLLTGSEQYQNGDSFGSILEFTNSGDNSKYEAGVLFNTDPKTDNAAKTVASELVSTEYDVEDANCANLTSDVGQSQGIDVSKEKTYDGFVTGFTYTDPKKQQKSVEKLNGARKVNLEEFQNEKKDDKEE